MMAVVLALLATAVSLVFAIDLARQFLARLRVHAAVWSLSLGLFSIASAMVAVGLSSGWSVPVYGTFWFAGALATVPLLAAGQLLLLDPRRKMVWLSAGLVVVLISAWAVVVSPMNPAALAEASAAGGIPTGSRVWGATPATVLLAPFNWSGLIVVGGCVWSALRTRRAGVLLIAVGVLVAGASFSFIRAGNPSMFSTVLAAGVTTMYGGFRSAAPRGVGPTIDTPKSVSNDA